MKNKYLMNPYPRWLYIMDLLETLDIVSINIYIATPPNHKELHTQWYHREKERENVEKSGKKI